MDKYILLITYVCGYEFMQGDVWPVAKCWNGTNEVVLGDVNLMSYAEAIAIADNGDVHIVGYGYNDGATAIIGYWWKNGALHRSFNGCRFYDISIDGNEIYISGSNSNGNGAYWRNGVETVLSESKGIPASSICVVNGVVYAASTDSNARVTNKAVYWIDGAKHTLTDGTYSSEAYVICVE